MEPACSEIDSVVTWFELDEVLHSYDVLVRSLEARLISADITFYQCLPVKDFLGWLGEACVDGKQRLAVVLGVNRQPLGNARRFLLVMFRQVSENLQRMGLRIPAPEAIAVHRLSALTIPIYDFLREELRFISRQTEEKDTPKEGFQAMLRDDASGFAKALEAPRESMGVLALDLEVFGANYETCWMRGPYRHPAVFRGLNPSTPKMSIGEQCRILSRVRGDEIGSATAASVLETIKELVQKKYLPPNRNFSSLVEAYTRKKSPLAECQGCGQKFSPGTPSAFDKRRFCSRECHVTHASAPRCVKCSDGGTLASGNASEYSKGILGLGPVVPYLNALPTCSKCGEGMIGALERDLARARLIDGLFKTL